MRISSLRERLLVLTVLACLTAGGARAQEFRATVTGRVTDPGGLAVPGATVSAVNTQTAEVATGFTTADGAYTIPFLKPGVYSVSAELTGFKKVTQANVQLEVGQTSAVNFQLQLGTLAEEVTVTGESPVLETSKADRGLVIDNERVTELPLNARNPFMLSYLSPGITYNGPAIYQRPFDNGAIATGRSTAARTATTSSCSMARPTIRFRAATTSPSCLRSIRCRNSRSSPTATTPSTDARLAASSMCR